MDCPNCAHDYTKTVSTDSGVITNRTRRCPQCGFVFLTTEAINTDKRWFDYKNSCHQMGLFDDLGDELPVVNKRGRGYAVRKMSCVP